MQIMKDGLFMAYLHKLIIGFVFQAFILINDIKKSTWKRRRPIGLCGGFLKAKERNGLRGL